MSADDPKRTLETQEPADTKTTYLSGGRTLTVSAEATGEVVELRNPAGILELRVRITEEGPVLTVEGVKVALRGAEAVTVETKRFDVKAHEGLSLHSDGELDVTSAKEMRIKATEDLVVRGKIIHLN